MSIKNSPSLVGLTSDKYNEKPGSGVFFKHQALLFDQIAVLNLKVLIDLHSTKSSDSDESYAADLKWLVGQGLIFEPDAPHPQAFVNVPKLLQDKLAKLKLEADAVPLITQACNDSEALFAVAEELLFKMDESGILPAGDVLAKNQASAFIKAYHAQSASELRYAVLWLRLVEGRNAVLAHALDDYRFENMPRTRKETVLQILLRKVPILDENTPWERIIDFRQDPDSKHKLLALKQWINNVASSDKSAHDIEDELNYLKSEYERALRRHRLEFHFGVMEAVVKPALEIMENLIKFKWSKLPDSLLQMRKHEIEMQKAEAEAPGKELSYLVGIEEKFGARA